jgi:hypothetical protein
MLLVLLRLKTFTWPEEVRTVSPQLSVVSRRRLQLKRAIKARPACIVRPSDHHCRALPINGNSVPIQHRTRPFKNPCPSPPVASLPFPSLQEPPALAPMPRSCFFILSTRLSFLRRTAPSMVMASSGSLEFMEHIILPQG